MSKAANSMFLRLLALFNPTGPGRSNLFRPVAAETGSVVVLIVMLISLLAFIPVGTQLVKMARQNIGLQLHSTVQADNVARAGLTDAVAWFRRQTTQPVRNLGTPYPDAAFAPVDSGDPDDTDTIDAAIGLVKEYDLGESNNLWARYEVRRQAVDNVADPSANDPHAVHDITLLRLQGSTDTLNGGGLAWYIESVGYVYRRRDPSVAYNVAPNEIVGRSRVATEIRRVALNRAEANAAVVITSRGSGTINTNCRVVGGSTAYGVAYCGGSGGTWGNSSTPVRTSGTTAWNYSITSGAFNTSLDIQSLFGVTPYELKLMADYSVSTVAQLPSDYPSASLVFIDGPATFDDPRPLRGGGILFVNGNLTLSGLSTNTHIFSGLIYVNGNCTITGPATISGTLWVTGSLTMSGGSDVAEVLFDGDILTAVQQQVGQYRENKSAYHVFSAQK